MIFKEITQLDAIFNITIKISVKKILLLKIV